MTGQPKEKLMDDHADNLISNTQNGMFARQRK